MPNPIIYLDHQYHNIEAAIKSAKYSQEELFDQYGEKLNHYLLLSELAKVVTDSGMEDINIAKFAAFITYFELSQFKPYGYSPHPFDDENVFIGEILYANDTLALCRIESVKYTPFSIIISITKQIKPFKLPLQFSSARYDFKVNGVT